MKIAILTFDGFNELDSFVAASILNRVTLPDWKAEITSPSPHVTSMNGVVVQAQKPLEFANEADVVLFGSGVHTRQISTDAHILSKLVLDPGRQLIGSQCSGVLLLHALGLLSACPVVCTDSKTRPGIEALGVRVLDAPFAAYGNVATAGGCLSAHYLATWVIYRCASQETAREVIHYVAPVGHKLEYVARALLGTVSPYIHNSADQGRALET